MRLKLFLLFLIVFSVSSCTKLKLPAPAPAGTASAVSGKAVVILLDSSAGMAEDDRLPNSIQAVLQVVRGINDQVAVGLVAFDSYQFRLQPLGPAKQANAELEKKLSLLKPERPIRIVPAVAVVLEDLRKATQVRKHIVMLTSGELLPMELGYLDVIASAVKKAQATISVILLSPKRKLEFEEFINKVGGSLYIIKARRGVQAALETDLEEFLNKKPVEASTEVKPVPERQEEMTEFDQLQDWQEF